MIVSIPCPSQPTPMGGVTVLYECANALARRGHEVHLLHGRFWGRALGSLDELDWFDFDDRVVHHLDLGQGLELPAADVILGTGGGSASGLPVQVIQGRRMFPEEVEQSLLSTPSLKLCVATWLVEEAVAEGVPRSELVYLPLGIDHDTFRVTSPLDGREVHVGVLYNDHFHKGWPLARAALGAVKREVPDLRVLVFGRTPPHGELPDWIEFVLAPRPSEVAALYNRCQVFVQASIVEGFGFTAVEAMACGCALVTSDNGGSRDYAVHDSTALVSDPTDVGALAHDVADLLGDAERRRRLATAGVELVDRFRWERTGEILEGALVGYVAEPGRYLREVRSA